MLQPQPSRPPPSVVRVPPPAGQAFHGLPAAVVIAIASLSAGFGFFLLLFGTTRGRYASLMFFGLALFLLGVMGSTNRRYATRRAEFLTRFPTATPDRLTAELTQLWRKSQFTPTAKRVCEAVAALDPTPARAQIVCLGALDVPESADWRFEPEIITATRLLSKPLLMAPVALAILIVAGLQWRGIIPGSFSLAYFLYPLAIGGGVAVTWIWRAAIRPTYVRMAPGIIQVMEYGLGKAKPAIRSYPMESGTVAVLIEFNGWITLTLRRGDQRDTIPIWQMRDAQQPMERIWAALLSTAPIPRMSEEELVG